MTRCLTTRLFHIPGLLCNHSSLFSLHRLPTCQRYRVGRYRQVQSDASTTLSEVLLSFGSVEGMTEDFLQPELAATAVKCANAMAATPDEHHWSSVLASLQTLSEWLDKSDEALTPTEKHLRLGELKVAWQQYCTIAEKASEQMTESDTLQSLEVFRRKAFDIFSARFEATVQGLAGAAVNGALGPLKATLHEAAQIAGGQSSHRHWGDGCSDFTLQGICKHAEVILTKEILVHIGNSEVKLTQDFDLLSCFFVLLLYIFTFTRTHILAFHWSPIERAIGAHASSAHPSAHPSAHYLPFTLNTFFTFTLIT